MESLHPVGKQRLAQLGGGVDRHLPADLRLLVQAGEPLPEPARRPGAAGGGELQHLGEIGHRQDARHDRHVQVDALALDVQHHARTAMPAHGLDEIAHRLHCMAVDLVDQVTGLQAGLRRRRTGKHRIDQHPHARADAEQRLGYVGKQRLLVAGGDMHRDLGRRAAAFESELWELDEAGQTEMLKEAGLDAPARDRLITALYRHLGLITFYTAGEPEAHAWSLRRGSSALDAAGVIHTDIARGFIRAEVVSYEDFAALKSDAKVKEAGKLRLEGRDYVMRDGDIIHIRFKI